MSAHSFGSKENGLHPMQKMIHIITVEFGTELRSKISIGPIRWIGFIHEGDQVFIWIVSFPLPPHPTMMKGRQWRFS